MERLEQLGSEASRDVTTLAVIGVGGLRVGEGVPGVVVTDAAGQSVPAISDYLCSLLACGASTGTVRSYALALLRWWRFLAAVALPWDRATRVEVRDFVLWMRFMPRPVTGIGAAAGVASSGAGYAAATINHDLAVLRGFYADRLSAGVGPLVNPVPDGVDRAGERIGAHHNPMQRRPGIGGRRCVRSCRPGCRAACRITCSTPCSR
jgi:hypothetical protein